MEIFLFSLLILLTIILFIVKNSVKTKNKAVDEELAKIQKEIELRQKELLGLQKNVEEWQSDFNDISLRLEQQTAIWVDKNKDLAALDATINSKRDLVDSLRKDVLAQQNVLREAAGVYADTLEASYQNAEKKYQQSVEELKAGFVSTQENLKQLISEEQNELDKLRATRTAAIEAQRREAQIKAQISDYCLQLSDAELSDLRKLDEVKKTLSQPRILCMLEWQSMISKPIKKLWANILGGGQVTGIYKITNQIDGSCYIGQSLNVLDRWTQHAKCMLGIDNPPGNKLYNAALKVGIWNFSWEVLEKCSREELDEKERFYIDLYNSVEYGLNSTKGNK